MRQKNGAVALGLWRNRARGNAGATVEIPGDARRGKSGGKCTLADQDARRK